MLDQNLSYRMLAELEPAFPGSSQAMRLELQKADDHAIWQYAKDHGFTIVTLDSDFHELATLYGTPPKIIWLKFGNRPRLYVANLLLKHGQQIKEFGQNAEVAVLEIY
nr:DUF5615 family PIN-like protein [Wenzhouxiangella sp. XN24]